MTITIDAVVENGLLRPMQPLPFREKDQVRITIQGEKVPTHTKRVLSREEMAAELNEACPTSGQPSVPLKHKVDYTQAF